MSAITFDLLDVFVAVVESGSIGNGALKLGISPSLASRKLTRLEDRLAVRLVNRSTRRLQLTHAGCMLLDWARTTRSGFDNLIDEIGIEQGRPIGLLKIACDDYMGHQLVLDTIERFRHEEPGIRFVVTLTDAPADYLEHGYDLAIHIGLPPRPTLIGRKIGTIPRILCASPQYIEQYGFPADIADLARHHCLVHSRSEATGWSFRLPTGEVTVAKLSCVIEANSYPQLTKMAERGLGVLRVAEPAVRQGLADGRLVRVLEHIACTDTNGTDPAVWLTYPHRGLLPRVKLFLEYLLQDRRWADLPDFSGPPIPEERPSGTR